MENEKGTDHDEEQDDTDTSSITYTQVACSIYGPSEQGLIDRRRHSLRAKLEREAYERKLKRQKSLINTFRNLFSTGS